MEPVFVSEVMGEGAEAHRLVRVGSWEFRAPEDDPNRGLLIEDTDLARHLAMNRNKLRQLIRTYRNSLDIQPVPVLYPLGTKSTGRPGEGFRLTREDALFIVTRSNATNAKAMTREMIRVFLAAMQGLLVPADHLPPDQAEDLRRELAEVRANSLAGIIGDERAVEVNSLLHRLAILRAGVSGVRGARRTAENELRNAIEFTGPGSEWASLPRQSLHRALRILRKWIRVAAKEARKAGRRVPRQVLHVSVQVSFPFGGT